jgi:RNA methyltransferase, TrmH family
MKSISSRDNVFAKHLIGLAHSSRERKKCGQTVLDGAHLVEAWLASTHTAQATQAIAVRESAVESEDAKRIIATVSSSGTGAGAVIYLLSDQLMDAASSLDSPANIMAVVNTPAPMAIPPNAQAVIVLDNVQDPGNVGSILRSAAAFGIKHALLGRGTAFAWSPKVLRAGQGAHFALNIVEGADIDEWIASYHGQTVALVPRGDAVVPLVQVAMNKPTAIMIGSEGAGLSASLIENATVRATIPMSAATESLNAAATAAIALYVLRQQRASPTSSAGA